MLAYYEIKLHNTRREVFRMNRTSNLYKSAALCQVFDNGPKQVSKHYVGLCSFTYSAFNAGKQCCQSFWRQLEGTRNKGTHLGQKGCRYYIICGKESNVTVMAARKLCCFLYYDIFTALKRRGLKRQDATDEVLTNNWDLLKKATDFKETWQRNNKNITKMIACIICYCHGWDKNTSSFFVKGTDATLTQFTPSFHI